MVMTRRLDMVLNVLVIAFGTSIGLAAIYSVYKDTGEVDWVSLSFLLLSCAMVLSGMYGSY